jgi:hypothetical protein
MSTSNFKLSKLATQFSTELGDATSGDRKVAALAAESEVPTLVHIRLFIRAYDIQNSLFLRWYVYPKDMNKPSEIAQ